MTKGGCGMNESKCCYCGVPQPCKCVEPETPEPCRLCGSRAGYTVADDGIWCNACEGRPDHVLLATDLDWFLLKSKAMALIALNLGLEEKGARVLRSIHLETPAELSVSLAAFVLDIRRQEALVRAIGEVLTGEDTVHLIGQSDCGIAASCVCDREEAVTCTKCLALKVGAV